MKTVLLAVLLLAGVGGAARSQTFYLDLSQQTLDVPGRAVAVEQVLDGRAGTPPIGIAYRAGKAAAIGFREGMGPALTTFIQSQLPARPTDHPVVLCLRRLHLSETLGGTKEQATADLAADVYERRPDGYHFVQSVAAQTSSQGREVTYQHVPHLVGMLSQCLDLLNEADWAAVAARPARLLAALPTDVPAVSRRAAILGENPRRGLYFRFGQFLANRPDSGLAIHVDTLRPRHYSSPLATAQWLGVARVRPLVRIGKDPNAEITEDLWGFCDGQQVFVKYNKQFYPLTRQGSFFTFVAEAPEDKVHAAALSQKQVHAGYMFGLVGAALAQTNIPDHTAEPMTYSVDLRTGAIGPYPGTATPVRSDTAYVYVYRMPQDTGQGLLTVYVEGREMGVLRPGQYLEVPWARFGKPMRLCLGSLHMGSSCQQVVPDMAQLNYLKVSAAVARPLAVDATQNKGPADLDELDKRAH